MENQDSSDEMLETFTWNVDKTVYSEPFVLGGFPWKICLLKSDFWDCLEIFLEAKQTSNMSKGWSRDVKYKFILFNQLDTNKTVTKEGNAVFNDSQTTSSCSSFENFRDPQNGFVVNDVCKIGVHVLVRKSMHEKQVNQKLYLSSSLLFGTQMEVSGTNLVGRVPNSETLSPVSSLVCIDPTKDLNADLHFASLRRVLFFLKTNRFRDMNDQACRQLQVLWDNLVKFKLDLSWLEPHVQSALGMKSFVERAIQVEKLKEELVVLELETERLKTKLDSAEMDLDVERDLLKEKGLKEINLDSNLCCGSSMP